MDGPQQFNLPQERPMTPTRGSRWQILAGLVLCVVLFAALQPHAVQAAWEELEKVIGLKSDPLPASPARISEHETDELARMTPQQQAERLLERSINHYKGAIELLRQRVESWNGQLELNPHLSGLLETALNANDLRVRAAAIEVELAAYNVPKTPTGTSLLIQRISDAPENRPWALWLLGGLGNRGVEPELSFSVLRDYVKDPDETTRFWAVEGMALLGSSETIRPLLDVFHSDLSMKVRERAACSLVQSGMLTKEQRMTAVPEMINWLDDPAVDTQTRNWAYQALHDITGAPVPGDPAAWRAWWNEHLPR